MKRICLLLSLCLLPGCSAVVYGGALTSVPQNEPFFLSTGGSPKPFRTLGFVQVLGFGVQVAGVVEGGEAQFDSTIRGSLVREAMAMGGNGVINIEFLDENPATDSEKISRAMSAVQNAGQGKSPDVTGRYVTVVGEVIAF